MYDLVAEGPSVWEQIGGAGPLSLEASAPHALADEREPGLPAESTGARMVAIGRAFGQGDDP
ncbi:MAG: hypothetical protein OXU20_05255 [Myxococcales bacterium]|nr:hypothetical protein [Myxococcales bacterium]